MLHIICFGNLLQGDDGFGVHVHARLRDFSLPPHVRAFDAGILGLGALSFFESCEEVIVVDALSYHGVVGRVHRFTLDEMAAPREAFSAHALDVNHLIHVLPILFEGSRRPTVTVIGAEIAPSDGSFSMLLSVPLAAAVDEVVEFVLDAARRTVTA